MFSENHLITCLLQAVSHTGIQIDPIDMINLYISLKSKSLETTYGLGQSHMKP